VRRTGHAGVDRLRDPRLPLRGQLPRLHCGGMDESPRNHCADLNLLDWRYCSELCGWLLKQLQRFHDGREQCLHWRIHARLSKRGTLPGYGVRSRCDNAAVLRRVFDERRPIQLRYRGRDALLLSVAERVTVVPRATRRRAPTRNQHAPERRRPSGPSRAGSIRRSTRSHPRCRWRTRRRSVERSCPEAG
jgi:hypothetical protein